MREVIVPVGEGEFAVFIFDLHIVFNRDDGTVVFSPGRPMEGVTGVGKTKFEYPWFCAGEICQIEFVEADGGLRLTIGRARKNLDRPYIAILFYAVIILGSYLILSKNWESIF